MKYSPSAQPAYGAIYCREAEADAGALTTMVYSIAPRRRSVSTSFATELDFCPMAT